MSDIPPARQCTMPTCEEEALDPGTDGSLCSDHHQQATGDETDTSDDPSLDAATIREHYERARPALEAVGALDAEGTVQSLGNYDYYGWYETRPETSVEAIEAGYEMHGRVFGLVDDYSLVAQNLQRVLYSTISYTETDAISWNAYQETDEGKDWRDDRKPTPEYGDLAGYAPFADIDLADEHKERPLPEEKQAVVERTIDAYIKEFAALAGDRDSVFALDSVGGAYVFISPQTTAPIAEQYDDDARETVYEALAGRVNDWLSDVRERVNDRIPQAEGLFEPDFLNNKNRLYKAPLSIHKSINGVVHPLDVEAADYEFVPVQDADDDLMADVEAWGEAFTDADHQEQLDAIIATLWDDYAGDDWQTILDAWLADEREREKNQLHERAKREKRQRERRRELKASMDDADESSIDDAIANQTVTPVKQDVFDAIDQIDIRTVVRSHASGAWDTSNRSNETTFDPSWRTSGSGMSCAVPASANTFIDNGCNAKVGPVKAFALGERILPQTDDAAAMSLEGHDYWEAVRKMRQRGYSIPIHIPEAGDEYDQTPYWGIVKAAVALGVCEADELTEREGSDGSTFRALPDDDGETFEETLEALEAANIDHGRDPNDHSRPGGTPVSALPLAQLDALAPEDRRRAARKRGLDWPTTDDAREQLFQTVTEVMGARDDRVIDAPTSLGKSYTIAATPWDAPQYQDITDDQPVIHLSKTTDARDEAVETSKSAGVDHFVLLGRTDACPCAAGDHDPHEVEDTNRQPISMDGEPISEWMDRQCDVKGLPFSVAHTYAREHNDQDVDLPCCEESSCYSTRQWDEYREGDHKLVHATHNFAFVPGLRANKNVVFDEEPDFVQDLTTERVRDAIAAFLREIDAPVTSWEQFIAMSLYGGGGDAAQEREQLIHDLETVPEREWFIKHPDAHILAPALARAIFFAEDRGNERRFGKTSYEPPRLDAEVSEDDDWNLEWVSVVLDDENDIQTVRVSPDMGLARSVIGLDAHPAMPVWQVNTVPYIEQKAVLEADERRLWRRYERGLRVVQVGEATRPLASDYAAEEYFDETAMTALLEQLRDEYGDGFRTAISTSAVEDDLRTLMNEAGIPTPETMHYGEEKSRNDFAAEDIGLVNGCIDPGDDHVINLLAELDLNAEPERAEGDCEHCAGSGCKQCLGTGHKRAHGRGFTGADAETAGAILASVRENHTAQSAGRYARNPDNPQDSATVFVRTNAMPPGFADVQVPGVVWAYGDKQQDLATHLREQIRGVSAKDAAAAVGCSKRHAQKTLKRWAEDGTAQALPGAGEQGATLYSESGLPTTGVADIGDQVAKSHVQEFSTYQFATCEPTTAHDAAPDVSPMGAPSHTNQGDQSSIDWATATDDRGGEE